MELGKCKRDNPDISTNIADVNSGVDNLIIWINIGIADADKVMDDSSIEIE